MTYIEKDETCRMALKHFGAEHQMLKMVEECNELANALMHYIDKRATADEVITELADVVVMLREVLRDNSDNASHADIKEFFGKTFVFTFKLFSLFCIQLVFQFKRG